MVESSPRKKRGLIGGANGKRVEGGGCTVAHRMDRGFAWVARREKVLVPPSTK